MRYASGCFLFVYVALLFVVMFGFCAVVCTLFLLFGVLGGLFSVWLMFYFG